jgi:hypothetical protein
MSGGCPQGCKETVLTIISKLPSPKGIKDPEASSKMFHELIQLA